jgi:hypothetical protein
MPPGESRDHAGMTREKIQAAPLPPGIKVWPIPAVLIFSGKYEGDIQMMWRWNEQTSKVYYQMFVWVFFLLLVLGPIGFFHARAENHFVPSSFQEAAAIWAVTAIALLWHINRRCSGSGVKFMDGLTNVASSMSTGWSALSLFVIMPVLTVVFFCCVFIVLYSDLTRNKNFAIKKFVALVWFFHRGRLRR